MGTYAPPPAVTSQTTSEHFTTMRSQERTSRSSKSCHQEGEGALFCRATPCWVPPGGSEQLWFRGGRGHDPSHLLHTPLPSWFMGWRAPEQGSPESHPFCRSLVAQSFRFFPPSGGNIVPVHQDPRCTGFQLNIVDILNTPFSFMLLLMEVDVRV